ncbi:pentatricopeptide repeat-containing protein At4g04370 [Malania oleifera]|uniref:pentatricopeptide repeat-containing protein At4g04370 n=1 Tax=Malania oleifera TaxID=397392 RepID=UPI0025AE7630|nr:pentatricopeptide repeat-containing protein At4g04370 [Malania oleifera]XP_057960919.1 pentatricopeptide repeat-containing protein At4g04370 [Malania oleifera]XP_057960920.1 pentatricopeptide repeat-containing protein At4g04370 [Malania oleifera]XP_057960921.1 pentatricopeptide repeat-containing protein At4g04370 [Malania oleifera]XP_057960922.1 pentatricopeptide repeat-containing protein At4g04370 [Malania oleifera]XP_057960923.1 pentatricopeptide repeat-containing protein At4g04370 [Malan
MLESIASVSTETKRNETKTGQQKTSCYGCSNPRTAPRWLVMSRIRPSFSPPKPSLPQRTLHKLTTATATATATTTKSFNTIINRLSAEGAHYEVLLTYLSMLNSNTPADAYTFPSLLKACTSLELPNHGLLLHQRLIVSGYSFDSYIGSSLINLYAKFGHINHARQVFDLMPHRNVVPWTAIIGCYSRVGDVSVAFSMYDSMRQGGVQPSSVTILGLLCGVSELIHVQCLHACSIQYGFEFDIPLLNSLLNVYCICRRIDEARSLFESMDLKDTVSWNSLISGYARIGCFREIVQLWYRMRIGGVEPDKQTFGSLVSVAAADCRLEVGKLVHGLVLTADFELDAHVEASLIGMYLRCGSVDDAFRIFERAPDKDVILWTAMISGLVQNECADKALRVFHCMVKSGMILSTATIASSLAACAQLGSFKEGTSIHGYILRHSMLVDVAAHNSLITMYAKCGYLAQSCVVFDRMHERDVVTWNAIVAGYAQNGDLCEALFLFHEMRKTLQRPDSLTVVSLLQACASTGALHQGKRIHTFLVKSCLGQCLLVDTALVDMYCKCGNLEAAQKCFDGMSHPDVVSWSAIIAGYGNHGKGETALKIYSEFLQTGIKPNDVIFLSVLSACSHNGLVLQGLSLFQSMTQDFGIEPTLEHRACIVDLLARAGRVQEAFKFFKRMFPEPAIDVLGILVDACRTSGNEELGEVITREILMLKPVSAGNYVQLAHSYASMGRWDGVGKALMQMKSLGLKKLPGWSSIELQGMTTTFFMAHNSHPQYEDFMLVLKLLGGETKAVGTNLQTCQIHNIS